MSTGNSYPGGICRSTFLFAVHMRSKLLLHTSRDFHLYVRPIRKLARTQAILVTYNRQIVVEIYSPAQRSIGHRSQVANLNH